MANINPKVEIKSEPELLEVKREVDVEDADHPQAENVSYYPDSKVGIAIIPQIKMEEDPSESESDDPDYVDEEGTSSDVSDCSDQQYSSKNNHPKSEAPVKEPGKYACGDCSKTYTSNGHLVRHRKVCKNPGQLPCHLCTTIFRSAHELRYHLNQHTGERPYVCRQTEGCGEAFFHPRYRVMHEQECGGAANQEPVEPDEVYIDGVKRFVCSKCGKANKTSGLFRRHKRNCHGLKNCHLCPMKFKESLELKYHLNLHSGERPFQCQKSCNESFYSPRRRRNHEKQCGVQETRQAEEVDPSKIYVCDICTKGYANMGHLLRHKRFVHNPNPAGTLTCQFCPLEFKNATRLRYHLNEHNGERPFPCRTEGCGEAFCNPARRFEHEGSCGKEGQFRCKECNLAVSSARNLNTHMLTHTEPQLGCTVCGKKYHHKHLLTKHMERHVGTEEKSKPAMPNGAMVFIPATANSESSTKDHAVTPAKVKKSVSQSFLCPLCKRNFTSIGRLKFHEKICIKPCHLCPSTFRSKKELSFHLNWHTGEKPFKCRSDSCDEAFHDPRAQLEHEKICDKSEGDRQSQPVRVGELKKRPIKYTCEHCGKKYASMGFALRHKGICNVRPSTTMGNQNAPPDEISIEANAIIKEELSDEDEPEEIVGI